MERKEPRVLLVEDDPQIFSRLKSGLELWGYSVDAVRDPDDAFLVSALGKYDFAILNIVVDSTTGFQIAKQLKKKDPNLKFCFIMGSWAIPEQAFGEDYNTFKNACYLKKSAPLSEISERINRLMQE
jgi:DNA-binding response OmpR family regulator